MVWEELLPLREKRRACSAEQCVCKGPVVSESRRGTREWKQASVTEGQGVRRLARWQGHHGGFQNSLDHCPEQWPSKSPDSGAYFLGFKSPLHHFFFFFYYLFIYLGCSHSQLWHVGSLVAACGLLSCGMWTQLQHACGI